MGRDCSAVDMVVFVCLRCKPLMHRKRVWLCECAEQWIAKQVCVGLGLVIVDCLAKDKGTLYLGLTKSVSKGVRRKGDKRQADLQRCLT